MIAEALAGKTLLVTGSTGFLGKSIVEKLLRSVPQVKRINLAIRSSPRRPAAERLQREVLASPAFRRLRSDLGDEGFARLAAARLGVIEIDLGLDGLGLDAAARKALNACDVVIHSAASVEFDNPADLSAQTNLLGAVRLVRELAQSPRKPHLVHISTAYVGGMLRGVVREETLLDPGLNWRHEAEVLANLRPSVEEESREPEVLDRLRGEARSRMGPAGTPAVARLVERLRDRWVKDRLVERGRVQARALGFSDIYSFTKAMAELAVTELHGEVPVSIVRPSIIESALAEPFPGWLEGFRMAEPLILAFARGALADFPALPDSVLDIIPVDYVVNAVLAVAADPPADRSPRVYHVASGTRNPLHMRQFVDQGSTYFAANPLRDRWGQPIATPTWTYPSRDEVMLRGRGALRVVGAAQWLLERLPLGARTTPLSDQLNETRTRLERSLDLVELYGIYTQTDCIFDTSNLLSRFESLPPADQKEFPFDPALYEWDHYCQAVHFPTVVRMSRAQTAPRSQPDGRTAPKADAHSALELISRRGGRGDLLAVFDIDGTLVDTNVVEYLVWMRLRSEGVSEWPAFAFEVLQQVPRWLYLERRSRAEFQRSFYRQYAALDADAIRRLGREALEAVTLRRVYPEGLRRVRAHKRAGHRVLLLTGALDVVVEPLAELLEVDVDCAHLEVVDGRFTGDLAAPPPAGEARSALVEEYARRHGIALGDSFAYADSLSDLPMLEVAGVPVVVNPDARLSVLAAQRGWRVERWSTTPGNWSLPIPDPRDHQPRIPASRPVFDGVEGLPR